MKVLVCGSRNFTDEVLLHTVLEDIDISCIIEGEATGADKLARKYAEGRGLAVLPFPALWNEYGRAAGPIRNTQMLVEGKPDLVVAFRGQNSRGTQNMINQAMKAGIEVRIIEI